MSNYGEYVDTARGMGRVAGKRLKSLGKNSKEVAANSLYFGFGTARMASVPAMGIYAGKVIRRNHPKVVDVKNGYQKNLVNSLNSGKLSMKNLSRDDRDAVYNLSKTSEQRIDNIIESLNKIYITKEAGTVEKKTVGGVSGSQLLPAAFSVMNAATIPSAGKEMREKYQLQRPASMSVARGL